MNPRFKMTGGTAQAGNTSYTRPTSFVGRVFLIAFLTAPAAARDATPVALVDSTGKAVARPYSETVVLVADPITGVAAPAAIGALHGDDGRAASGLATWQSGGSVLYTSSDCSSGAHVYSSSSAGLRAAAQVQTPAGIVLYVGAIGHATTVAVRSIRYDDGCRAVSLRQNGLVPVDATVNLTLAYPPPLSFR